MNTLSQVLCRQSACVMLLHLKSLALRVKSLTQDLVPGRDLVSSCISSFQYLIETSTHTTDSSKSLELN